jgi:hypothetical protein
VITPRYRFKGNKAALPTKACVHCGRPMSWRKAWAANWDKVKYCSDSCRRGTVLRGAMGRRAR